MTQTNNALIDARFDAGLTLTEVATLLGIEHADRLGLYERNRRLPTLKNAIALEILYQRPLAALFPEIYAEIRASIYAAREKHGRGAARLGGAR